jgi:hypothetical protein
MAWVCGPHLSNADSVRPAGRSTTGTRASIFAQKSSDTVQDFTSRAYQLFTDKSLVVHDTTEFSYKREDMAAVGFISKGSVRKDAQRRPVYFTTCGINLHSSLAADSGRTTAGFDRRQVLEPKSIQGQEGEKEGA